MSTTVLKKGSKGTSVRKLQQALVAQGYGIKVDGIFGSKTEAALKSFQKSQKLTATGKTDTKTNNLLYGTQKKEESQPKPTPPKAPEVEKPSTDAYEELMDEAARQVEEQTEQALEEAELREEAGRREAYIDRVRGEERVKNLLAQAGHTGGMAESSALAPSLSYYDQLGRLRAAAGEEREAALAKGQQDLLGLRLAEAEALQEQANLDREYEQAIYRQQLEDYYRREQLAREDSQKQSDLEYKLAVLAAKYGDKSLLYRLLGSL